MHPPTHPNCRCHFPALCIASYLAAIVAANGLVTYFGQAALPYTAFILIPFDLMARDVLHEHWKKAGGLWGKMLLLIITGSVLSYVSSFSSVAVSTASAVSFLLAGTTDTLIYSALDKWPRVVKMNSSNLFSAVVDSIMFPLIAFGSISFVLSFWQAAAKFIGGVFWTALFLYVSRKAKK